MKPKTRQGSGDSGQERYNTQVLVHIEEPVSAIQSLEEYYRDGGVSVIQATFNHTYFVHPDAVRDKSRSFRNACGAAGTTIPGERIIARHLMYRVSQLPGKPILHSRGSHERTADMDDTRRA